MVTRFKELVLLFEKLHIFERKNSFFFQHIWKCIQRLPYLYLSALFNCSNSNGHQLPILLSDWSFTLFILFDRIIEWEEGERNLPKKGNKGRKDYPFLHPAVARLSIPRSAIAAATPSAPFVPLFDSQLFYSRPPGGQVRAIPRVVAAPPILAFKSGSSACDVPDRVGKTWPTGGVAAPRWSVTGSLASTSPTSRVWLIREESLEGRWCSLFDSISKSSSSFFEKWTKPRGFSLRYWSYVRIENSLCNVRWYAKVYRSVEKISL